MRTNLETIPEEELLLASLSALTLEEVMESASTTAESAGVSLETAAGTTLSAHRVVWIIAVVISRSKFCEEREESAGRINTARRRSLPESDSTLYASLMAAIFSSSPPTSG
jgi:hypothetical protein